MVDSFRVDNWVIHKFGGSSLEKSDAFRQVYSNIKSIDQDKTKAVVLSAVGGTTDLLIKTLNEASIQNEMYLETLDTIEKTHKQVASQLIECDNELIEFTSYLSNSVADIKTILRSIWLTKGYSELLSDMVSGFGELWSTKIMYHYMNCKNEKIVWIDSRDIIVAEKLPTGPSIDWEKSTSNIKTKLQSIDSNFEVAIFPGYVAKTQEGNVTTLQRNGSDLTASILGVLLKAGAINIWTNVNGIYSADPNRVPNAVILDSISYVETLELAYFGAKVIHPGTIAPAMFHKIPIRIRNTFRPENPGTLITLQSAPKDKPSLWIKGISTFENVSLLNLEGSGMIGVPGISEKLFGSLKTAEVSVIMISQASSEYSICVAIDANDGYKAKKSVEQAFAFEIKERHIQRITLDTNCGILAVVGEKMVNQPGIAAILFNALSRSHINVRMISQGSSERNISVILDQNDLTRGLRAAHAAFYLSHLTISVGIVGIGLIGKSLINQITMQAGNLKEKLNIDLQVTALTNSKNMILGNPIELQHWAEEFDKSNQPRDLHKFADQVDTELIPHSVIIDCSASDEIAQHYNSWLSRGIHVITANKKANSGSWGYYKELQKFITKGPSTNPVERSTHYFYETTVGAGLPIVSTLRDLLKTGDHILEIYGIFSGTISYIFNQLSSKSSFSEIVKSAHQLGYTEPDPRDDLSGIDFARKLVILAREIGLKTQFEDVSIEPLLPAELFKDIDVIEFFDKLVEFDPIMRKKVVEIENQEKVMRYVGIVKSDGTCSLQLQSFDKTHVFANMVGSENIVLFKTDRYDNNPLIVRGPGAGAAVTSGGIFAELLRLADMLGSA